jgi:hypothetical protein
VNGPLDTFREEYRAAFTEYMRAGSEAGLRAAYELGRTAMLRKLSVLDIAAIHHEVLFSALGEAPSSVILAGAAEAGSTFVLEVLATYEMVQRGLAEAHETARLEQQHAQQLRRLADASLAISAAGTVEEIARRIPEQAVRVVGGAAATATVETARHGRVVQTFPSDREAGNDDVRVKAALVRRNGSRLGGIEVFADAGWTFTSNDEPILAQLAQVAGVALENAELYEQERLVAVTLQQRLLPGDLPQFPGVTLVWRYLPGWGGIDIGGDWYDAMALPGQRLALIVGDVMGKGIRAAAGMGQLRVALRAYAIEGHSPAVVIQRLDQVVEELEEELATVVYLEYDPATAALRYANAGHPPPLLIAPDGSARMLTDGLSPPLGCLLGQVTAEAKVEVEPGSTLVVYTDGLVERRGADLELGLARLREVAAAGDRTDLDEFCDLVLAEMDADNRGDDIALLAARLGTAR